jgi:hypothetical protein
LKTSAFAALVGWASAQAASASAALSAGAKAHPTSDLSVATGKEKP